MPVVLLNDKLSCVKGKILLPRVLWFFYCFRLDLKLLLPNRKRSGFYLMQISSVSQVYFLRSAVNSSVCTSKASAYLSLLSVNSTLRMESKESKFDSVKLQIRTLICTRELKRSESFRSLKMLVIRVSKSTIWMRSASQNEVCRLGIGASVIRISQ